MGAQAPWAFLVAGVAILATGNVLSGITSYLLMICYPVTVAAVVVFMGSWVSSLFNWGRDGTPADHRRRPEVRAGGAVAASHVCYELLTLMALAGG